jgi:hypothetical protein
LNVKSFLSEANIKPTPNILTATEVPPSETNGSGNPLSGTIPITPAIFQIAWKNIQEPTPIMIIFLEVFWIFSD